MSDPIIRSKLAPSLSSGALLVRERLIRRLDLALDHRATVLHAPAGYGKTSLLTQWRQTLVRKGVPTAWTSLDENDKNLFQFLSYLTEACRSGGLVSSKVVLPAQSSMPGVPVRAMIGGLLSELAECTDTAVVLLDDFHRVESPDNCHAIDRLFAGLPPNVHIVLSSRKFPAALSLADLRAREELLEVDCEGLRFTESEIRDWLGSMADVAPPDTWFARMYERTEGWPIALNLVRRWCAEGMRSLETLEQLTGRNTDLSDYFLEQVFDGLDQSVQTFLLKTSMLERVNGDLANLLCETEDAWTILEDLQRCDLFVDSLDRERFWYRYHGLFAEFLQERMRRRFGADLPRLHRIACGWFQERELVTEAIHHAFLSDEPATVAGLFESLGGWHYALKGHVDVLERSLSFVDDELLSTYPRLWLGKIFLSVRRGEIERAEAMLNRLLAVQAAAEGDDAEFRSELLIMRSLFNLYADNDATDSEFERLEQLSESLRPENDLMHAIRYNLLCVMHAKRGGFDACMAAGDRSIRHFRAIGSVFGETFIYLHQGYACMEQGRLRDAEILYGAGRDLALEHFGADSDLAAIAGAFLADTAYERNNLAEARRLIEIALPHIERFDGWMEVYVAAYTTAMKLAHFSPASESPVEVRNRARSTAANRSLPRLRAIADLQEAELEFVAGNAPTDERPVQGLERVADRVDTHLVLRRLQSSVLARSYLRSGNVDRAVRLLEDECNRSRRLRHLRSFVSFSILLAVAQWRQGAHDEAVAAFEASLAPSLFEGTMRPFIDEGEDILEVIRDLTRASESRLGSRLRDRFLAVITMEIGAASERLETGSDELTPREREVLRYLVQGRTNREIAEAMPISVNTVKFHLKNIFGKLGVSTRSHAVTASLRRRYF